MTELSAEEELDHLLSELDEPSDAEHPDVSISRASGLTLSAFNSGLVVVENVESDDIAPMHQRGLSRDEVRRIFRLLAHGEVAALSALDWQPGYGT